MTINQLTALLRSCKKTSTAVIVINKSNDADIFNAVKQHNLFNEDFVSCVGSDLFTPYELIMNFKIIVIL